MTKWAFGEEREIAPGHYATLISQHSGWVVWCFEHIGGKYATIGKGAEGNLPPMPLGVGQVLFGQTPFVYISSPKAPRAFFRGQHYDGSAQIRRVGERFMQRLSNGFEPLQYDGAMLDVILETMPGPRSYSKIVTEHVKVDMTGTKDAVEAALSIPDVKN